MKITDFISPQALTVNLKSEEKPDVISEMVDLLVSQKAIEKKHRAKVIEVLMAREALGSTAIGQGIAIPHGKFEGVNKLIGALGISKKGVNFDSLDGEPAYIFFLLIAPADSAGPHLKALAKISRLLKDKYVRDALKAAKDEKELMALIEQEDARLSAV
jgi:PTS system nitrogen regulatory IIA component